VGLSGLQAAALAVVCLVVLAHGLAWELLTTPDRPDQPIRPSVSPERPGPAAD
jgi:hypothetical protein